MAKQSKFKRLLKRTAIVTASILGIALLILAVINWRQARALEARLAPLRDAGRPTSILDLQPSPVSDDKNAYAALQPLKPKLNDFADRLHQATRNAETEQDRRTAKLEAMGKIVQENPNLIAQLRELSELPHYQLPLDYDTAPSSLTEQLLPHLGPSRNVARLLEAHAAMSLSGGKPDEAARDAVAIYRWGELVSSHPMLVSGLMSMAIREIALQTTADVLYAGGTSEPVRKSLLSTVADETKIIDGYVRTLDTERAFGLSSFNSLSGLATRFLNDRIQYVEMIQAFQQAARQPSGTTVEPPNSSAGPLVALVEPAMEAGLETLRRLQAKIRAIEILAAWQRQGADPAMSIEDLNVSPNATTDPFDGSKMKVQPAGETLVVYSVGFNQTDDGGAIASSEDAGIAPNQPQ
jgi:hypothetical protein